MLEHDNCIPYLFKYRVCNTHKADAELKKLKVLDVNIINRKENMKCQQASLKNKWGEEVLKMEEQTKPLFAELKQEKEKLDW